MPVAPLPGSGLESDGSAPPAPDELSATGREWWGRIWAAGRSWLAPQSDALIVENLCRALDEAAVLRLQLRDGADRWYQMSNGSVVTHPRVNQLRELETKITAWSSMLGLSPSDRSRLGLAEVRVRDELDELSRVRSERRAAASSA